MVLMIIRIIRIQGKRTAALADTQRGCACMQMCALTTQCLDDVMHCDVVTIEGRFGVQCRRLGYLFNHYALRKRPQDSAGNTVR
jgi:hypothetical protein